MIKSLILVTTLALLVSSPSAIRIHPPPSTSDYNQSPEYANGDKCQSLQTASCHPSLVHIATTLDFKYLRGSIASVHSILRHAACPENVRLHFITADFSAAAADLAAVVESAFPRLSFKVYPFRKESEIKRLISSAIRPALEDPLNYARIYLSEILDPCVNRVVYLDSDTIVVDEIQKLWSTPLTGSRVIGAPVYCRANLTSYFNGEFWSDRRLSRALEGKGACYFNTGVMVVDLERWRSGGDYTRRIEWWMKTQKERRIYELGSLPPLMLVFAGEVEGVDHRWNQHGLGGDNVVDSCRRLHGGAVSLMHWSGKGKPWVRLDRGRPCPIDYVWAPFDLYKFAKY
ncbi:putative galacturonosyltransferase-like 10 [Salvia divinorum]|uniref:Hexosyltransferase n=1 Tax=Salvia divinorum TaxID=28513 RepID=A0ABD1G3C8_SALDI